ncbi:MAG: hypothetical protein J5711_01740 [Bacteroidales bacterium]|nr:hypothetical protein [Bacteroidales bacterium]
MNNTISKAEVGSLKQSLKTLMDNSNEFFETNNRVNEKLKGLEWKDAVAERFKKKYEEQSKQIANLLKKLDSYGVFMTDSIKTLENEYLN